MTIRGISIPAALIGGIVDVGASMIANTIFLFSWTMINLNPTTQPSPSEFAAAIKDAVAHNWTVYLITFVLGSLFSVLGGYIAAKIAKSSAPLNGALSAWLCVGLGVFSLTNGSADQTEHFLSILSAIPLSIAFGALGGFLWAKRNSAN